MVAAFENSSNSATRAGSFLHASLDVVLEEGNRGGKKEAVDNSCSVLARRFTPPADVSRVNHATIWRQGSSASLSGADRKNHRHPVKPNALCRTFVVAHVLQT